jgi:hypothetical protein
MTPDPGDDEQPRKREHSYRRACRDQQQQLKDEAGDYQAKVVLDYLI